MRLFLAALLAATLALIVVSGNASAAGPSYVYDALGRLVAAYDSSGNAAVYRYDAVGNLLSIGKYGPSQLAAFALNTSGSALTIYGTDFCSNPTVTINGTAATVTSASSTTIVVSLAANTASGPVVVACGSSKVNVGTFTSSAAPAISGFSPASSTAGTQVTISGKNFSIRREQAIS